MHIHIHHHYPDLSEVKAEIAKLTDLTIRNQEATMAKIDELKTALDELATSVTESNAEIETQLAVIANPGTSDADVDAAIARIREVKASVQSGVDRLKSDNVIT